jgi:hypothetical protein
MKRKRPSNLQSGQERYSLESQIERVFREHSERPQPPEAFLISDDMVANLLLVVSVDFLGRGQSLLGLGLPLVGAVFDPDWGFSGISIVRDSRGTKFICPDRISEDGDVWGYRMCPIENRELPSALAQLTDVRSALAKHKKHELRPKLTVCLI